MSTVTDYTSVSLEKTRKILPDLYERNDTLLALMQVRDDVEKVGIRAMRGPMKTRPSGKFRQADFDGGDLGRGNASGYTHWTISPLDFLVAVETTKKMEYATDSTEKALFNVTKRDLEDAMWNLKASLDCLLQTPGTGQIGVLAADGIDTLTLTLGGNFGSKLILEGQTINAYTYDFATKRSGDMVVQSVNPETNEVIVDALASGLSAPASPSVQQDLLVIEGLSGANPVSLYGIPYHHSDEETGTWLGLDREDNPGIRTPSVNANSSNLTPQMVRLAINKSRMRLGIDSNPGEFTLWGHMSQEASWEEIAQQQMLVLKSDSPTQGYEPFYAIKTMAGIRFKPGLHADPTRLDFLRLSDWGRAQMKDIDYVRWGTGDNAYIIPIYGTSGGAKAAQVWYLGVSFQVFNQNPRAGAYIKNLGVLDGYGYP